MASFDVSMTLHKEKFGAKRVSTNMNLDSILEAPQAQSNDKLIISASGHNEITNEASEFTLNEQINE
tara:strand:+ start:161 stop:361 length:201 start_codon:yes stop_codon:yes gene_type:complete